MPSLRRSNSSGKSRPKFEQDLFANSDGGVLWFVQPAKGYSRLQQPRKEEERSVRGHHDSKKCPHLISPSKTPRLLEVRFVSGLRFRGHARVRWRWNRHWCGHPVLGNLSFWHQHAFIQITNCLGIVSGMRIMCH
jgi:hypothetical protein